MNSVMQTYSPRVRPLEYDALALNIGCQDFSGTTVRGFIGLEEICVDEHDSASSKFAKSATVALASGPASTGTTWPFLTAWVAWVAAVGVRVLKNTWTAGTNTTGTQSQLFPNETPTSLSMAFSSIGQMALAAQTSEDQITLRRYTDDIGTIEETIITGRSPLLWFTGELLGPEDSDLRELVLLYLRPEKPRVLFGRFESEWGTEVELAANLPVILESLAHAEAGADRRLKIYARNSEERDVSIYSAAYPATGDDEATLEPEFASGFYYLAAQEEDAGSDDMDLSCEFVSGYYLAATESAGAAQEDSNTLALAFVSGEYQQ